MGLILALPCDQQAPEHADWATITHLPQLAIYAQFLQLTQPSRSHSQRPVHAVQVTGASQVMFDTHADSEEEEKELDTMAEVLTS